MQPQYVAGQPSCATQSDAAVSQPARLKTKPYIFHRFSHSFPHSYPQGSCISFSGWAVQFRAVTPRTLCRRLRCQRAFSQSWPWALLWQQARALKRLTMLFLLNSPSLPSRFFLNTKLYNGRANRPVQPTQIRCVSFHVPSVTGGEPC